MQTAAGPRLASALAAALSVATLTAFAVAPLTQEPLPSRFKVTEPIALPVAPAQAEGLYTRQAVISRGESLGSLMRKLGDLNPELIEFVRNDKIARQLLSLRPGVTVRAEVDAGNRIQSLEYPMFDGVDDDETPIRLDIERSERGKWQARAHDIELDRMIESRVATVTTSLFAATDAAGIPESVAARIPDVFSSDIDFHREVQEGDTLRIVYEVLHDPVSNAEARPGRILAVEYQGRSRSLGALWFERADAEGGGEYYNFEGRRLKRSFLRSPMEFTRVSSGFTNGRRHPVFRDWRAHKGVDYAAPIGTNVRTIGEGTIDFIGNQRGYGNVVVVKHDAERKTLYAHLNRFAPKLTAGSRVQRGQLIGQVGKSGWATGPHLHFELLVNDEQVDPEQIFPPAPLPLDTIEQARFEQFRDAFMRRVSDVANIEMARFE
ncbi:MAG: M23 family metallopeptidase [Burkholderiaceae bacterium]